MCGKPKWFQNINKNSVWWITSDNQILQTTICIEVRTNSGKLFSEFQEFRNFRIETVQTILLSRLDFGWVK